MLNHDKERCTMYCDQCDIPVCDTCIASHQHLGHKFIKILQVLDEKKENIILKRNELKQTIYPIYQDIVSDVQNRMSQLEKEYGDLSTAITEHGEDCHRKIDKLVQKLKAQVDEMKNTQLQTLQKHLDEVDKTMSCIEDEINKIDISLNSNEISEVFGISIGTDEYRKIPPKIMVSLPTFSLKKLRAEQLSMLFGTLSSATSTFIDCYSMKTMQKSSEAGSSPPVKHLLDEPETVTTIDTGYDRYLITVACLSGEEIWTRRNDSTMKLFSINQGSLLKSIRTKPGDWPWDIAVTKSGDLVYTDYSDRTVNIVKNERIEEVIRLQNWKPKGVCSTSSGDLLVIIVSADNEKRTKVVRYSGSTEKQTIQFDDKGKRLYSSGHYDRYITENKNPEYLCV
ncbi:uncharacterized protein LOC134262329 [Saccostrea cucullata]|uniref:uncharacterized protein LOC134262329 n=1 Tax=Saccostrea cuccullata TaxID=36930 RepID=UPI002ED37EDF